VNLLRNAWLDIAVTALIAFAVFDGNEAAQWAIMIYTPFMVLLKISAFTGRHSPSRIKPRDTGIPVVAYHILYGANVGILVFGSLRVSNIWWWVAACWGVIWLLSALTGKGKPVAKST